jgi:RNA polymerase sigma-70 factor (ECF subfamily)
MVPPGPEKASVPSTPETGSRAARTLRGRVAKLHAEKAQSLSTTSDQLGKAGEPPALPADSGVTLYQLHRQYFDFTWRSLRHLGVPVRAVEDAAQDVWLTVHRQLGRFEGRSTPRTWLFGIALNTARNYRRSQRRHPSAAELPDESATSLPTPEAAHASHEALALVERFIEGLDEPSRILFTVYLMEDVTAAEAAEILDIDVSLLYERARRLRRAFKRWFEALQGERT